VVSTHLKTISQVGSFPQIGVKIPNIFETTTQNTTHETFRPKQQDQRLQCATQQEFLQQQRGQAIHNCTATSTIHQRGGTVVTHILVEKVPPKMGDNSKNTEFFGAPNHHF